MLSSPFDPPSQRQNILASQLKAAHGADDQRQLRLLRSQWVHRFGVDSLPEFSRVDPVAEVEPVADQPGAFERVSNVVRHSFREVSRALDEPTMSVDHPADEFHEVTAPPLSTPPSLRRWLVSGDDSVHKAS
ncbi:hypothetical protein [Synechococcus sp. A15-28]|uniref:hypothetical protein n=1 Tax=Synechococcus sp. A15-28 TaxID=1050638 RepID=UPI001649798D|nr:hypothetical protein [Synechococcus sp. A15-28]QNI43062.1 hypothetical protein SynA1528_02043 [Synechococcus sp. A15-28]